MNNVFAVIAPVSGNAVTVHLEEDPHWEVMEQSVAMASNEISIMGQFEVRGIDEQGNKKTYALMPMPE